MIKVTETSWERDWEQHYKVLVEKDGKKIEGFSAGPLCECPEDATLGRDLGYAFSAVDFMRIGYEAGKSGEEIEFVKGEHAEDD